MWVQAILLGLAYASLGIGVFLTLRILNFPDITADGSLTLGASLTAFALIHGFSPLAAVVLSIAGGILAGSATGYIHTRLRVNGLLSGILVMTALYSVNLRVLGRSNVPLVDLHTVFSLAGERLSLGTDGELFSGNAAVFLALAGFLLVLLLFFHWFFRTNFGLVLRATGDNEKMVPATGISTSVIKVTCIALSNGCIALSGSLVAQYQGFADVQMGIGTIVFGLASVILGETLTASVPQRRIFIRLCGVVTGTVLFRILVSLALMAGFHPGDLKFILSALILIAIILPETRKYFFRS